MTEQQSKVAQLLGKHERDVLQQWLSYQISATTMRADLVKESDLREQSRRFLQLFIDLVQQNGDDQNTESWKSVKNLLADLSQSRAAQGFSPSETATFVFSLKQPIFDMLRRGIWKNSSGKCG
jgi:rsbT co-antagonist protein RsbR